MTKRGIPIFKLNVYDDQGLLYERDVQENNRKYVPSPENFMDPNFPVNYEGVNPKFFSGEMSLFKTFKKIEFELVKVE